MVEATNIVSTSMRYWGLDWTKVLPWTLDGISVESSRFDVVGPFLREHHNQIFGGDDGRFLAEAMSPAKLQFCNEADVFAFRHDGRLVGGSICHPSDWSTYYQRLAGLLPDYQGNSVLADFTRALAEPLAKVGVQRIEAEACATNTHVMRALMRIGYVPTGTTATERWGTLVRLTKFISADAATVFERQLCSMPFKR